MLSMILTPLIKLIIFKILLQRCGKLCAFLILTKICLDSSININLEYLLYHFVSLKCTVQHEKPKQTNCLLRQHFCNLQVSSL